MHPNPRKIAPILIVLLAAAATIWYFTRNQTSESSGSLSASGTIEATQVTVASELGGRVEEVLASIGDKVEAGQVLVRMDDELVIAQLAQAEAQLSIAEANYALIAAGTPIEQRDMTVNAAKLEELIAQQTIDTLNDTAELVAARTQQEISQLDKNLDQAGQRLDTIQGEADQADIDAAKAVVVLTKDRLDKAREDFSHYENKPEDNLIRANLQAKLAETQKLYDAAVARLNNLEGKANEFELSLAEANQVLLLAQLEDAKRRFEEVKNGPDPDETALARARLDAAQARLTAALALPTKEQLDIARAQVNAAQAAVNALKTQIARLVITAPTRGTVLNRAIEPGEVAMPGAPLLTLGALDDLTVTIYLPEDRYGEINLGDRATVEVDSFPGKEYDAEVIQIADQAEFTPRNVQTQEGRRTTVFAIKLSVQNTDNKLKPGMPADIRFE